MNRGLAWLETHCVYLRRREVKTTEFFPYKFLYLLRTNDGMEFEGLSISDCIDICTEMNRSNG